MSTVELAFGIYGRRAGLIRRDGGSTILTYDTEYVRDVPNPTPLSLSMPVSGEEYKRRYVEAFLKGLLPDNEDVRERWARTYGVKPGDTLGLVGAIGRDCAGGAVFAHPDDLEDAMHAPGVVVPIAEREIADRLRTLRTDDSAWHVEDEHWSLAGGQGKLALARSEQTWGLPRGSAPSTHIIKPGITRLKAQAMAEHISMRALDIVGLDVARTEYREFEGQPAVVVERYDRRSRRDGRISRVHQEDMVQTFGLVPSKKYEADQGPGVKKMADRLRLVTRDDSVERFVLGVIANYLLGAPDGHAKNYSLLLVGRQAQLAPLYDISTGLIADGSGRLAYTTVAQSIGGEKRFGEVEERHWTRFAAAASVDADYVLTAVRDLAQRIPDAVHAAISELPTTAVGRDSLLGDVLPRIAALDVQTLAGLKNRRHQGRVTTTWFDSLQPAGRSSAREADRKWDRPGAP